MQNIFRFFSLKLKKVKRFFTSLATSEWFLFLDYFAIKHNLILLFNLNFYKNLLINGIFSVQNLFFFFKFFLWLAIIKGIFTLTGVYNNGLSFTFECFLTFYLLSKLLAPILSPKLAIRDFFLSFYLINLVFFIITVVFLENFLGKTPFFWETPFRFFFYVSIWSSFMFFTNFIRAAFSLFLAKSFFFIFLCFIRVFTRTVFKKHYKKKSTL